MGRHGGIGRSLAIVVATGALAALAPACSGALSKQELIEQADQICERVNEETTALGSPTADTFPAFVDAAKGITDGALVELRALTPPGEDEDLITEMLDAIEEAASYLPQIKEAVVANDPDRMAEIGQDVAAAATTAQQIAVEYGFNDCAQPPGGEVLPTG